MDHDVVIRASGLGKKYAIGHRSEGASGTLRDAIVRNVGGLARTTRDMLRGRPLIAGDEIEEFWALRDINFEVRRGDVLGIIGRNGAGKSTLLKILSRITEPTEGRVEIRGRVASLLEVGTGFHPELTGRENIFLNGAILGMTRAEIRRKFDEIVAFAGVEKFLDTPVKRFSSGMYVRLAFAVAAHIEPEILVIDEVLAVGDAEFQQKCLGKIHDVAGQGRTVLFVSHNMAAVSGLCGRSLLLRGGSIALDGSSRDAIEAYLNTGDEGSWKREIAEKKDVYLEAASISKVSTEGERIEVTIDLLIQSSLNVSSAFEIALKDGMLAPVGFAGGGNSGSDTPYRLVRGQNRFTLIARFPLLATGRYHISIFLTVPFSTVFDRCDDVLGFEVVDSAGNDQARGFGCISGTVTAAAG